MSCAIEARDIGKRYRLGTFESYRSLRDVLARSLRPRAKAQDMFWALKDVSFDVGAGEVVGVIGRNGAGKSTLLKILSRITTPTEGRALLRGRVGSLLEVGTGFHPELTGRENIFLSGAILGMRRAEIARKFDEIVGFAEIERFIDTPAKHYSSGMYVRLAFSVAAHLEPEILLVDEVLAVGDAAFQRKCLGKMSGIASEGRTVLFVSHNMAAVIALTQRCLLLDRGRVVMDGPTSDVAAKYLADAGSETMGGRVDLRYANRNHNKRGADEVRLVEFASSDARGTVRGQFREQEPIVLSVTFDVRRLIQQFEITLTVCTTSGVRLFSVASGKQFLDVTPGRYRIGTTLEPNYLRPGIYSVHIGIQSSVWQDGGYDLASFAIVENPLQLEPAYPTYGNFGAFAFPYRWGQLICDEALEAGAAA